MPIGTFITQPAANSLNAAYRPVVVRAYATATGGGDMPPAVFCDIYINDVFYKTLSKSQYTKLNAGINTEWEFFIEDAMQEYLRKFLGTYGGSTIQEATPIMIRVKCKLRSSGYNIEGFITPEETAPVQGTGSTSPVPGTGTETNTFYVVNATPQHNDDQELTDHLNTHKYRSWSSEAFPLSHRPDHYKVGPDTSDYFPIVYTGGELFKLLRMRYRFCSQTTFNVKSISISGEPSCNAIISNPVVLVNGTGWLVTWSLISGAPVKYFVSTPAVSGGAPQETITTQYQYLTAQLGVGSHEVTVRPLCYIGGTYYFGEPKTVTIVVGACTPVAFIDDPELLPALVDVYYSKTLTLAGTGPFSLSSIVKPAWMAITVLGSTVTIEGTPTSGDAGIGIPVSFTVSNCGGASTANYSQTIDVFL